MRKEDRHDSHKSRRSNFFANLRQPVIVDQRAMSSRQVQEEVRNKLAVQTHTLNMIREDKYKYIVEALDLFDGQLSLEDMLSEPIPFINYLIDAKWKYENDKNKASTGKGIVTDIISTDEALKKLKKAEKDSSALIGKDISKNVNK